MKYLGLVVIPFLFNLSVSANGVDRNATASMIDKMLAKGILSPEDAKAAKSKLSAMPDRSGINYLNLEESLLLNSLRTSKLV